MRLARALVWVGLGCIAACGGKQTGGPANAGARAPATLSSVNTQSGEPGWIGRGSAAVKGDGGRQFYGVGAAGGIKNAALLRSTADNRARAELAKVFETFSASLMKDYASSDGAQNVENATKTFASLSLEGVEIVDRYVGADGTLYSLASLDVARMGPAIEKAKQQGIVKSQTQPQSLDDMFDRTAKKETAAPPVVAQAQAGETPPPSTSSGASERTGAKPGWVDGSDARFAAATYLCAVGLAERDRPAAENAGYAALSRIFSAKVEATSKDFMGAYSKTGAPNLDVQTSESITKVSTTAVLSDVHVLEVYTDPAGTVYALTCLERAKAARSLKDVIDEQDSKAGAHIAAAAKADKAGKVRELSRAVDAILAREAANAQLRIIDLSGVGSAGPYAPADVSAALEAAVEALKVGVRADGPYDSDFRGALIQGLTTRGYKVADLAQEAEGAMDVLVTATIRVEDGGAGTGSASAMSFARGVVQVEVKNVAQNSILAAFNESRKEGSRNKEEAERRAVRALANKIAGEVGSKIDATMRGK